LELDRTAAWNKRIERNFVMNLLQTAEDQRDRETEGRETNGLDLQRGAITAHHGLFDLNIASAMSLTNIVLLRP